MNESQLIELLRPMLTDEFLATLVRAVRTRGWSSDLIETSMFADWCFEIAGKKAPDELDEPYVVEEE